MGRPAEKWPTYALENCDKTIDRLRELEKVAKAAQDALVAGNALAASSQLGDVRVMALECMENLLRAQVGKYRQQEKAARWQRPEQQAPSSTTQRVAAHRP